nr:uncharacterized protein CI109_001115 [Kwoniella shandongensis]KAA5530314.1 hypothetical protein CI109_001115 [Kwoniella shandongensis]
MSDSTPILEVEDVPPTILTSRTFAGILPSTKHRNVAWNEDGQCLFITRRGVTIVTPHIATTLPPPLTLVKPNHTRDDNSANPNETRRNAPSGAGAGAGGEQARESDDDIMDIDPESKADAGPSGSGSGSGSKNALNGKVRRRIRRPKDGEVKWWSTGIEVDRDGKREEAYGWTDIGEESTALLSEKEVTTRQAIWSASGLSDLGGCLLVVLSSVLQVSVYAPRNDPYSKQWDEIADLTLLTKDLLAPERTSNGLDERGMMEMRTTCMQWSEHIHSKQMTGVDGSLLALANRAGQIAFWSYGADKRFRRVSVADLRVTGHWITDMAWSTWREVDEGRFESHLALCISDGSTRVVLVRRSTQKGEAGLPAWTIEIDPPVVLDRGDKRAISSISWLNDVLIWTKPGSVHLLAGNDSAAVSWRGLWTIRLERVGNWASANALGPCIGLHLLNPDTLLVVLSSLTAHLITSFSTSPSLAPQVDSLRPAIAMRDAFLEHIHTAPSMRSKWKTAPIFDPEGWTAHTSGWASVGTWGSVASWLTESVNFHNLDSSAEGNRSVNLVMSNLGNAGPAPSTSVLDALAEVVSNPSTVLHSSPGRVLMPYLLHITCSADPESYATRLLEIVNDGLDRVVTLDDADSYAQLSSGLWAQPLLDSLRLRLVLAIWGSKTLISKTKDFQIAIERITSVIYGHLIVALLQWAATISKPSSTSSIGSIDRQFLQLLVKNATEMVSSEGVSTKIQPSVEELSSTLSIGGESSDGINSTGDERCPACGTAVDSSGKCEKGHVWSRCSITRLLITHPHYRLTKKDEITIGRGSRWKGMWGQKGRIGLFNRL